jgi:tetratricopeptide (TPR) repeat protein
MPFDVNAYPMGPQLRAYLKIDPAAYRGAAAPRPTAAAAEAMTAYLRRYHDEAPRLGAAAALDLLDELVSMDLPAAATRLAERYPEAVPETDFRAQLALGVASMLLGDLEPAAAHFRAAQAAMPEEPAPYVNLAQILLSQGRLDEAEIWALAGLDAEPNHFALWDLLASLLRDRHGEYMPETLMALAEKRCSWAGLSLAANLISTGDRYLKASLLERLHHQGERDPQFLIELTAAHGVAGDFAKIPPLVWQAERLSTKGLPWQLHVHCAQAQLALGKNDEALAQLEKAKRDPMLPPEAVAALDELAAEAASTQTP